MKKYDLSRPHKEDCVSTPEGTVIFLRKEEIRK